MDFGYRPGPGGSGEPVHAHAPLTDWHTGPPDELGDRLLVFDNGTTPSLELLRFRPSLTATPAFEVALRRRVQQLSAFRHPSFATVRGVQYLAGGQGLVLVSDYTPGRRLAELLRNGRDPSFAISLIRQLTPALAALHAQGVGIAHGALTPTRIVVTPDGRPTIVEHVLGSALERLEWPLTRLSTVLGIAVPPAETVARPTLDSGTDLFQLGLIALSLLLGRRLRSDEGQTSTARLLDEVIPSDGLPAEPSRGLRVWLQRALRLDGQVFQSSDEAIDALTDLPPLGLEQARRWQELVASSEPAEALPVSYAPTAADIPSPARDPATVPSATPASTDVDSEGRIIDRADANSSPSQGAIQRESSEAPEDAVVPARQDSALVSGAAAAAGTDWGHDDKPNGRMRALVAVLALCAIAEAFVIGILLQTRWAAASSVPFADIQIETPDPGASVLVDGRSAGLTPVQLKIGADTHSISVVGPPGSPPGDTGLAVGSTGQQNRVAEQPTEPPAAMGVDTGTVGPAPAAAPAPQRSGGIRLVTPIELEVFEGDRRLGSSATGIVSVAAGRHELELVNSVLGFRVRELVDVKGGQVVSVAVARPNGVININALPWAEVWIDGRSVGETPIGNLSIPIGEHEILFRHPQLGERRQTAVVRLDGVTRVSANLQRQPPPR